MKVLKWLLQPVGLLILLCLLSIWVHVSVMYLGYSQSIFCFCLPLYWDAAMIVWVFAPLAFAGIYYLTRNYRQSRFWQYIHVISCFMPLLLYYCWSPFNTGIVYEFVSFTDPALKLRCESCTNQYIKLYPIVSAIMAGFFKVGQIALIGNLIYGFIRGKKTSNE